MPRAAILVAPSGGPLVPLLALVALPVLVVVSVLIAFRIAFLALAMIFHLVRFGLWAATVLLTLMTLPFDRRFWRRV
ncbi:MAG: hypothetical protein KGL69_05350 [Alphaproteobacteria bacterium]|nr:hypothetical protein [Alphaproteobacteria bacterium]